MCPREAWDSPSNPPIDSPNQSGAQEIYPLGTLAVPSSREWMAQHPINVPPPWRPTMSEGQAQQTRGPSLRARGAQPQHRNSWAEGSPGQASTLATIRPSLGSGPTNFSSQDQKPALKSDRRLEPGRRKSTTLCLHVPQPRGNVVHFLGWAMHRMWCIGTRNSPGPQSRGL
jgi:hypothetical protein